MQLILSGESTCLTKLYSTACIERPHKTAVSQNRLSVISGSFVLKCRPACHKSVLVAFCTLMASPDSLLYELWKLLFSNYSCHVDYKSDQLSFGNSYSGGNVVYRYRICWFMSFKVHVHVHTHDMRLKTWIFTNIDSI